MIFNAATLLDWAVLSVAGLLAGAVNTMAGGGSLISFPVLVALGYNPLLANVTNAVATVPGYVGGCIGFRREISEQMPALRRLGFVSVLGALAGSALLVSLPADSFRSIVGWLVLASAILMAVQPWIRRALEHRVCAGGEDAKPPRRTLGLLGGQFVVAVYGGYFAAGLGVMMLAVLGTFSRDTLHRLNALKSALSLIVGIVSAMFFAFNTPVAWTPAIILAAFGLIGGLAGARLARAVNPEVLRRSIIAIGVIAGVALIARSYEL